jgi:hypothetical protein
MLALLAATVIPPPPSPIPRVVVEQRSDWLDTFAAVATIGGAILAAVALVFAAASRWSAKRSADAAEASARTAAEALKREQEERRLALHDAIVARAGAVLAHAWRGPETSVCAEQATLRALVRRAPFEIPLTRELANSNLDALVGNQVRDLAMRALSELGDFVV